MLQKIEPAVAPLRSRATGAELVRLGVEANVRHTAADILENSPLVRAASEAIGRSVRVAAKKNRNRCIPEKCPGRGASVNERAPCLLVRRS